MNAFEFNKVAGAVLSALLFIFGTKTLVDVANSSHGHGHDHGHEAKAGYTLPAPSGAAASAGQATAAAFNPATVVGLLGQASADAGKDVFKACVQCHRTGKGEASPQGPNLHDVVGRDIGKVAGFQYSPALSGKEGKWTFDNLASYLHDPRAFAPGNKMAYAGLKDDKDLADLLAFLRTQADAPVPLPK